jgi:hypothetical protein
MKLPLHIHFAHRADPIQIVDAEHRVVANIPDHLGALEFAEALVNKFNNRSLWDIALNGLQPYQYSREDYARERNAQ